MRYRTVLSIVFVMAFVAAVAQAEVPTRINYQGFLTDASTGDAVDDNLYVVYFRLYDHAEPGGPAALWVEEDTIAASSGLFSVLLGNHTPITADLFSETLRYLGIQLEGQGEMYPRTQILSAGYAFHAQKSDTAGLAESIADNTVSSAKIQNASIEFTDIGQNGADSGQVMKWNGTKWIVTDDEMGGSSNWSVTDSVLFTDNFWGIARGGADSTNRAS